VDYIIKVNPQQLCCYHRQGCMQSCRSEWFP